MEKYSWNFDENAGLWNNDAYDTIGECIEAAREDAKENGEDYHTIVFIGENVPFVPTIDAQTVLDQLEEDASEFGDVGDDWEAYDFHKKEELEELTSTLTEAVSQWLKKYGYTPNFYAIENIKPYPLYKDGENRA